MTFILLLSLFLNVVLAAITIKRFYYKFIVEPRNLAVQDKAMPHYLNRHRYFELLPICVNEIIFLGDSQIQNFDVSEQFKNPLVINRGINGDSTGSLLTRLDMVLERCPSKVFLQIGINDLLREIPVDTVVANIQKIIRTFEEKSPDTKIYLHSILPCSWVVGSTKICVNQRVIEANQKLKIIAANSNVTYIELYDGFHDNGGLKEEYDCGDSLHLSGKGYLKWYDLVTDYVNEPCSSHTFAKQSPRMKNQAV